MTLPSPPRRLRTATLLAVVLAAAALAGCLDAGGDGDGGPDAVTVRLVDAPATAMAGEPVTFAWEIDGPEQTTTDHTAIHWDTESHGGDDAQFGDYEGGLTPPQSGDVPGAYTADLTFDAPGTYYLRAHAIVGDENNILSDEHAITVS